MIGKSINKVLEDIRMGENGQMKETSVMIMTKGEGCIEFRNRLNFKKIFNWFRTVFKTGV